MRKIILSLLLVSFLLLPSAPILASTFNDQTVTLPNPLGEGNTDVAVIIGTIIKGILGIIGALVLLMFIRGAQIWLLAAGSAEKISAGGKTMVFAAVGAVVVFFSYLLLKYILVYLST